MPHPRCCEKSLPVPSGSTAMATRAGSMPCPCISETTHMMVPSPPQTIAITRPRSLAYFSLANARSRLAMRSKK